MTLVNHALRAGHTNAATPTSRATGTMLLAGGGGALGSAVLETLLASGRYERVRVLVTRTLGTAVAGLDPVLIDVSERDGMATRGSDDAAPIGHSALVVLDRERHVNGRELAFYRPTPESLPMLAAWLHRCGVRTLVIALPHSPAQLPDALKHGLANIDEYAVSALGFERLVIVRTAQRPSGDRASQWLQRLADGVLAQMRLMIAPTEQPVRAAKVAQFISELMHGVAASAPGTRVAPPELVWQAAQLPDPAPLVRAWLDARELPPLQAPKRRW